MTCFVKSKALAQQVAGGKMKAYGITAQEKSSQLPTAESFVQAFGPKFEIQYRQALFAAETPATVIDRLNSALQEVVADPAILNTWAAEGSLRFRRMNAHPRQDVRSSRARLCVGAK